MDNADFRNDDEFEADLTDRELQQRLLREADATVGWLQGMALFPQRDDLEAVIAALLDRRRALAASCAAAEAAEEEWLQAIADRADSERALFQKCRQLVEEAQAITPANPQFQALAGLVAQWQKHMPRED